MPIIETHLEEMKVAREITDNKLKALEDLLAVGDHTVDEQQELEEDAAIARSRLRALDAAIASDTDLFLLTNYPTPLLFKASDKVIQSLLKRVSRMEDLVEGFDEEITIGSDAATIRFEPL
jgi:hypothetical protein